MINADDNLSRNDRPPYSRLVYCALFSLWANMFGLGIVTWLLANRGLSHLPPNYKRADREQLIFARTIGKVSTALFVLSCLVLMLMAVGHGRKYRSLQPNRSAPAQSHLSSHISPHGESIRHPLTTTTGNFLVRQPTG